LPFARSNGRAETGSAESANPLLGRDLTSGRAAGELPNEIYRLTLLDINRGQAKHFDKGKNHDDDEAEGRR
jgi:hypothetical protein